MIQYLTEQVVALVNALGGAVLTVAVALAFVAWTISRRVARRTEQLASIKHEETVVAEANRHSEKVALIKANDPKMIEGMNRQLSSD